MQKMSLSQKIFYAFLALFLRGPIYIVLWGAVAVGLGILLESMNVFLFTIIIMPLAHHITWSVKEFKKSENKANESEIAALSTLKKVDYYYYTAESSISASARDKMLALFSSEKGKTIKVDSSKILHHYAFEPGKNEHYIASSGTDYMDNLNARQQVAMDNLKETVKQKMNTGLYVELDDLENPKIFVNMTYKQAEGWVLLLTKLIDGTLDTTSAPQLYPASA